ncbi:type II toxin-antitoxin system Phd/YefM family antitoxin [Microbacterium sp. A93]|uniref:type II toxin-antitoxin system Phd/YefM family antitoxin n=1 Tax=Microbacterium sp. A93 TaxID=3450716 RepID=UPI003F41BA50
MRTVNMHEAKTNFSRLVEAAVAGERITIAKAGRPMVKLVRVDDEENPSRTGFLRGLGRVPQDFDSMHVEEITDLFQGRS